MIFPPLWIASGLLIFLLQCWASVLSLSYALALVSECLVCTWVLCASLSSFSVCQGSVSRKPVWNMWMILCKKGTCLPVCLLFSVECMLIFHVGPHGWEQHSTADGRTRLMTPPWDLQIGCGRPRLGLSVTLEMASTLSSLLLAESLLVSTRVVERGRCHQTSN